MSRQPFKGQYIINGKPCLLYLSEKNELIWLPYEEKFHKHDRMENNNRKFYKKSAKFRLAKQKKINFDSLLSIEACCCDRSLLRNKKEIQCSTCSKNRRDSMSRKIKSTSAHNENEDEYNSARSSSFMSSSKSPSPVSVDSSLSDSSLGFVDADSSNESENFSALSATSLIKSAQQPTKQDKQKRDIVAKVEKDFKSSHCPDEKRNKTEKEYEPSRSVTIENQNSECQSVKVLKIYYVIEKRGSKGRILRLNSITIEPSTTHYHDISIDFGNSAQILLDELTAKIKSLTKETIERRPKRLLVFINPYGGKGRAIEIYETKVKHVFDVANISVNAIVTEYANHAREMIEDQTTDLNKYDGIICVGGDGMFSELMNGILFRANKKHMTSNGSTHADENNAQGNSEITRLKSGLGGIGRKLEAPSLPIGVIGAGSTDANSFGVIGTNDSVTAALNMVLGRRINIDICSIHPLKEDSKILRFVSTFVSYGYFGDIIRNSEALRWMGPKRYDVCAAHNILRHRSYAGEIKILLSPKDGSPSDEYRCSRNCLRCSYSVSQDSSNSIDDESTITSSNGPQTIASDGEDTYTSGDESGQADCDDRINNNKSDNEHERNQHSDKDVCIENNNNSIVANNNNDYGSSYEKSPQQDEEYVIIKKTGSFVGINTAIMACRCPQTKKGLSPNNHLGNGCADLILVSPCSRIQYLNYLFRTGWTKKSPFDLEYVKAYRCRQFDFVAKPPSNKTETSSDRDQTSEEEGYSSWNVDGELLSTASIRVKVNCQLLPVFGTGEPMNVRRRRAQEYSL